MQAPSRVHHTLPAGWETNLFFAKFGRPSDAILRRQHQNSPHAVLTSM